MLIRLRKMGYDAYIVGGTVRDFLLDVDIHDIDIATNCPMEKLQSNFKTHSITKKTDFEHLDFGVLLVLFQGNLFEVAQFRTEKGYDGRRPAEVQFVKTLEEDVKRRDFTINALAMNEHDVIFDYVGGISDLNRRIIRAVGDPEQRFEEDYLRMMRAVRFASKTGFSLESNTRIAITRQSENITHISPERISSEIVKASNTSSVEFANFIELLSLVGLLEQFLPEIAELTHLEHNPEFHPEGLTVFEHVIETIRATRDDVETPSIIRIGSLLHDVGKSITFSNDDGLPHYYRHEKAGTELAEEILKRLRFPAVIAEPVLFAVSHHMMFTNIEKMKASKVARLVSHPYFRVLAEVARADSKSRGEKYHSDDAFDVMLFGLLQVRARWEKFLGEKPQNLVNGKRIIELTGLKPSRAVGEIKKAVEEKIIEQSIDPEDLNIVDGLILEAYHEINKGEAGPIMV